MGQEKFGAVMGIIVPQIFDLIMENHSLDEMAAADAFYSSKVYSILEREDTKLWHLSPITLFNMYDEERNTGDYVIPEEA